MPKYMSLTKIPLTYQSSCVMYSVMSSSDFLFKEHHFNLLKIRWIDG